MSTTTDYELIATPFSYYSARVRACLQYKRLPYRELNCNFDNVFGRVLPATGEGKFPVVFCPDGVVLTDSCDIVEALELRHPQRPVVPEDGVLALVSVLLETLTDEFLAVPFIYYRWVPEDTRDWALDMFRILVTTGVADAANQKQAAEVAGMVAGGVQERVRKVGLDNELLQAAATRVTRRVCDALERALTATPFVLGNRPSQADLALMNGLLGHLFLDPCEASNHIRRNCTHLTVWLMRMYAAAGESGDGELFLPASLPDLLNTVAQPFQETALAILDSVDTGLGNYACGDELPASLGSIDAALDGAPMKMSASPYVAWKLQRLRDAYGRLGASDRVRADVLLESCGFLSVCRKPLDWRIEKTGNATTLRVRRSAETRSGTG